MRHTEALNLLLDGRHLGAEQVTACLEQIIDGRWSEVQIAAFLMALRAKPEQPEELAAGAQFLLKRCVPVAAEESGRLLDTAGTGGDGQGTFNISTAAAFVAAGAGVPVAKHGNRAQSGVCGSADLLGALGADLAMPPQRIAQCLAEVGICFMFAQAHHPSLKAVAPVRRELGVRTVFNLLGPLVNPAGAKLRLAGVFADEWVVPYAQACRLIGMRRAVIVHAHGLDEFSLAAPSHYALLDAQGAISEHETSPEQLGLERCALAELKVDSAAAAQRMFSDALDNRDTAAREAVVFNAAAALFAAGAAADLGAAVGQARAAIAGGAARAKLNQFVKFA